MISRRLVGAALIAALAFSIAICPRAAHAQAGEANSKAAAEALFSEAVQLMDKEDYAAACSKFNASQKLDPALGTVLRLADCFDRLGKTASAWAMFKEAASTAGNRNQVDRERIAAERAAELEKRLSWLELKVPANSPPGLELKLNGIAVPSESWSSALPVDPGPQAVEASAPGYKPWAGSVEVATGPAKAAVEIPSLERAPRQAKPKTEREAAPSAPGSTQRMLGYIAGGVGLAALATSGILSFRANDLRHDSLAECRREDPNACTQKGVTLRDDAISSARAATYPFLGGAALLVGGAVLVLTAPSARKVGGYGPRFAAIATPSAASFSVESPW